MVQRVLFGPGGATEAKQDDVLTALADLLTELSGKLEPGQDVALNAATLAALETVNAVVAGTVALDAPTLAALETITATISNLPADYPDSAALAALGSILAALGGTLTVAGTVALDATTLAALETITVLIQSGQVVGLDAATLAALESITVSGAVALDAPTLAALENINAVVSGTVALDAPTLAALESITATIAGSVAVTGPLTDTQMRAADVNTADSGEREYTHVVATVTAAGDTTVHTPAAGKRIRLRWIYAIALPGGSNPIIDIKFGASVKYRVFAISKRQVVTGATDAPLIVNLSTSGTVAVTALLEEIT